MLHVFEHCNVIQCKCGLRFILFKFVKNINESDCIMHTHAQMSICQSSLFKRALENENNALITTLTTRKINAEKLHFLSKLGLTHSVMQDYMEKLKDYRHVDDLNRPDRLTLARGAIICDIKIGKTGVLLLCKTHPSPAMFHVSMDESLIFQRLTPQERIILVAMDYMDKDNECAVKDTDEDTDEDTDADTDTDE